MDFSRSFMQPTGAAHIEHMRKNTINLSWSFFQGTPEPEMLLHCLALWRNVVRNDVTGLNRLRLLSDDI